MNQLIQPVIQLFTILFYEPTYNLLMFFFGLTHSFPWAIVLVTLAVRSALIPLFMRQLKSSKMMQELAPQVQEIQRRYKGKPLAEQQQMQVEVNALYKANGVNPLASCLPTLIQLPFLYGLYGAFNEILNVNRNNPVAVHNKIVEANNQLYPFIKPLFGVHGLQALPQTNFLLGINLAQPDHTYILPVLAAIGTFVQIRMSLARNKVQKKPGAAPDPNAASMQMMQYLMPVMTLIFGLRFAAGLALYWVVGTLFTVVQQYFVNGRSWGPLLDGMPFLKPAVQPAIVDAGPGSGAIGRYGSRARVTEEPPVKPKLQRALPQPKDTERNAANDREAVSENGNGVMLEQRATPRPAAAKQNGVARPSANKKDAVRLVTAQANGNGAAGSSPIVVTRAPRPAPVTSARPAPSNKKVTSTSRPRKRGR